MRPAKASAIAISDASCACASQRAAAQNGALDTRGRVYTLIGGALRRVDDELTRIYPTRRRMLATVLRNAVSERRRVKFFARLAGHARNAATFCRCNRYLMLRLRTP